MHAHVGAQNGLHFNALRGIGLVYGPDATAHFLHTNALRLVIRSHEARALRFRASYCSFPRCIACCADAAAPPDAAGAGCAREAG
jgi:hypothetical protein